MCEPLNITVVMVGRSLATSSSVDSVINVHHAPREYTEFLGNVLFELRGIILQEFGMMGSIQWLSRINCASMMCKCVLRLFNILGRAVLYVHRVSLHNMSCSFVELKTGPAGQTNTNAAVAPRSKPPNWEGDKTVRSLNL